MLLNTWSFASISYRMNSFREPIPKTIAIHLNHSSVNLLSIVSPTHLKTGEKFHKILLQKLLSFVIFSFVEELTKKEFQYGNRFKIRRLAQTTEAG